MTFRVFIILSILILFTFTWGYAQGKMTGIYLLDTLDSKYRGPDFSITGAPCELHIDGAKMVFSIKSSLLVSSAVVDSLQDTIYSFSTRQLPPGEYEIIWRFSDRTADTLPFMLWLEFIAEGKITRHTASIPFCAPLAQQSSLRDNFRQLYVDQDEVVGQWQIEKHIQDSTPEDLRNAQISISLESDGRFTARRLPGHVFFDQEPQGAQFFDGKGNWYIIQGPLRILPTRDFDNGHIADGKVPQLLRLEFQEIQPEGTIEIPYELLHAIGVCREDEQPWLYFLLEDGGNVRKVRLEKQ
jgi:hypothetical protein